MKKLFKKKKRSVSEVGSLASLSHSGYDISPKKDLTKLHKAAYEGDLTKLKSLLKKTDVNELDKEKRTALHLACANGKIDVVKMLTDHPKINLDLCDKDERTALMKCVQCEFPRCLEILLRKGAATNRQDVNGNTALHLSISIPNTELTILLLDYGIDIETKNNDGNTPLHVATSVDAPQEIISTLISDGSDLNSRNISKRTPLMLAASRGNIDTAKQLLAAGADTSLEDVKGWTANDIANSNGHHPLAYIIVEQAMKKVNLKPLSGSLSSVKRNMSASSSASGFQSDQRPPSSLKNIAKETPKNLSRLVGGPAVEVLGSSDEDSANKVENKASVDKNDVWSVTDDDNSVSIEEVEKPKKINVLQLLNKRKENKSVVVDVGNHKDENKDVLTVPHHQTSNLSNDILEKGHRIYLEKDIDVSNSWSISTGSEVSEDHKKPPEEAAKNKILEEESVKEINEISKLSHVTENIQKNLEQKPVLAPSSPWDSEVSSDDVDEDEEPIPDVKKNLMNELGFDEDVESDEDLKDSSSDWDSDVEDVESLEKFEVQKLLPGTSKLTFDDEKLLDEEEQEDIKEDYSEKIEDTNLVIPAVTAGDRKPETTHKHELIKTKKFYSCQSLDEEEEPVCSPKPTKSPKKQCETYKPRKVEEDETNCSPVACISPQSSPKSTNNRDFVDPNIEKRSLKYVMDNLEEAHSKNEKICCELEKIKERNNFLEEENVRHVALIRNLNLELNQMKQNQKTLECEVKAAQQNIFQLTEDLNMERCKSRRLEAESRELLMQLKAADQTLSHVECNRNELRADLERERRKLAVREQVDRSNDEIDRDTTRTKLETLNLMLQDKDAELVKLNAECETLRQTNIRYKNELIQLQQDGEMSEVLTKINTELNNKNEIITQEKNEAEEAIRHNAIQYKFQMDQVQENLENQIETLNNERKIKEDALHDVELLNCQQETLKSSIKDLENRLEKESENSATYQQEIKKISIQRDDYLQKLHKMEINESSHEHELNNIRTNLLMSKNEIEQLQNTLEKERKEMREIEKKLNESNLKNAKLDGKIQSFQLEISQMESERLHLKSEVENTRSSESQGLSEQQEKFNNIISAKGREIIELEKTNSMLTQQTQSYQKEIERLRIEKLEKEKELTSAQQDRIEKHKALSFNESTMAQQTELNRILQEEKKKIEEENNLLHQNLQKSYDEMNELKLEYERKISSSSIKSLQDLENLRSNLNGKITSLQEQLNTSESQYNNLQIQYKQLEIENSGNLSTTKQLQDDSITLKDKLMDYEDEIRKKEDEIKEKEDKIKVYETEVNSHRDTWKKESKTRLKCSADLQRVQFDRDDAVKLSDQYKQLWEETLGESKALQAKSLFQTRKIELLKEELESSRKSLSQELQAKEDLRAKYHLEVGKRAEISKSNRIVEEELERNSDRIQQLESMINELKQNQKQNIKQPLHQDYPHGDTSEKTFNLTEELRRMKDRSPTRFSPNISDEVFQNAVNAEVNEKLSTVNIWLREQAQKQEINDKVREEYEIQRRKSDQNKIAELKRELEIEKSKNSFNPLYMDKHVSRDLQKTLRENALRREMIQNRLDQQNQQTVFYPHNSISRSDHISSTSVPPFYGSNKSWEDVGRATSQPALNVELLTSTPKSRTNSMVAKAFTKLDESLRKKQNSEQQSIEKLLPSNNNSYLYSNHYSNSYKPK